MSLPEGYYITGFDATDLATQANWSVYPNATMSAAIYAAYQAAEWKGIPFVCGQYIFFPFIPDGETYVKFAVFNSVASSPTAYSDTRQITLQGSDGLFYTFTPAGVSGYGYDPMRKRWTRRYADEPVYIPPWVSGGYLIQKLINSMWG